MSELGEFLRARRGTVTADQVGLPAGDGRRVAGLRREEVAALAGVSVDYYTRLEQGRERHPSERVLDAIARALRLDVYAANHLLQLALGLPITRASGFDPRVSEALLQLMSDHVDVPAFVLGPALDVLAANDVARALYSGFARFDNLLRMVFLDPEARVFYRDWPDAASGAVRSFRAASAAFRDEPSVVDRLAELEAGSRVFVEVWARQEVRPRTNIVKDLWHRSVGDLRLTYQGFSVLDAPGQQLFLYTAESGTAAADGLTLLARTAATPAAAVPDSAV